MEIQKQTVYLPVSVLEESSLIVTNQGANTLIDKVQKQEYYLFSTEQLNKLLSDVIKDTLNTAAEEAEIVIEDYGIPAWSANYNPDTIISKESITNTFEETFNKFKV